MMTGNKKLSTLNWTHVHTAKLLFARIVAKMNPNTCSFPSYIRRGDQNWDPCKPALRCVLSFFYRLSSALLPLPPSRIRMPRRDLALGS